MSRFSKSVLVLALFGASGLDAEAIKARDWANVGPVWKLVLLGGVDLAFNPCERAEIRLLGLCHGVLPGVTAFRP